VPGCKINSGRNAADTRSRDGRAALNASAL
jgi:hypothetical protein